MSSTFKMKSLAKKLTSSLIIFSVCAHAMAAGALAINTNQGSQYGFAYSYPNSSKAQQHALSECGSGCEIVLTFDSGCGAYAADQSNGSSAYGWGEGSSSSSAQNRAMSECQSRNGSNCVVRVWGCNAH